MALPSFIRRATRRALIGLLLASAAGGALAQNYPDRPLTLIVPWGAGGGTDAVARMIASLMEKDLGQPVNVVNRTGGSGVVGHSAIAGGPADGYTIGMITVEITMMHHQKLTELNPTSYTPIALVNLDPAGFQVRADSPYKNMGDVLAAIKAAPPGKFKASGTGQGGIWHLALAGWLRDAKVDPANVPWVPSNGAAPGLQDLVAGGIAQPAGQRQVPDAALAGARGLELAGGRGLDRVGQCLDVLVRRAGVDLHARRVDVHQRQRRVAGGLEVGQALVMHHGDFHRDHAQRVAVGRRGGDGRMADHARAARAVDHVERLAEVLLEDRRDDARGGVGAAARAPGADQRDRAVGEGTLSACSRGQQ